jgi:hypothetical protein
MLEQLSVGCVKDMELILMVSRDEIPKAMD